MESAWQHPDFPIEIEEIYRRVYQFDPIQYGSTRNYLSGAVSRLSPYISRGVLNTRIVANLLQDRGIEPNEMVKFLQELAWRDYWQQVWMQKGDLIDEDLRNVQTNVKHYGIPISILKGETGIQAVDLGRKSLVETGYVHNHVRMYMAMMTCNIAGAHWYWPAKWMFYYLLDGDWASNALSWQWVAGSNSNKKYFANQENIDRFTGSSQPGSFLDVSYETLEKGIKLPERLYEFTQPALTTILPESDQLTPNNDPVFIYGLYNLDPEWRKEEKGNRILLLEPHLFEKYPVCNRTINFLLGLSQNIDDIKVFCGSYKELKNLFPNNLIRYRDHPLNRHFGGIPDKQPSLTGVEGYYPSFFAFWKKASKALGL